MSREGVVYNRANIYIYIYILEAKGGGRKLALQNGKVEGSEVGKNTALFLEAVAQSSRRQDALHKLGGANDSR